MKISTLFRRLSLGRSAVFLFLMCAFFSSTLYAQHYDVRHSLVSGLKLRYTQILELQDGNGYTNGHIVVGNIRNVNSSAGGLAVTRLNNTGEIVWTQVVNLSNGSPAYGSYDVSACLLKDANGTAIGFACGIHLSFGNATFTNKSYIMKFDLDGNVDWTKKIKNNNGYSGGEAHKFSDLVQNANGDIAFVTSARVSGTKYNAYVGHYSLAGQVTGWHREYNFIPVAGATDAITAISIDITSDGGYILTGQVRDHFTNYQGSGALTLNKVAVWRLQSNGDITWSHKYDFNQQEGVGIPWDDSRGSAGVDAIQTDDDNDGQKDDGFIISYHAMRAIYSGSESPGLLKLDGDGTFDWMNLYQGIPAGSYGFAMEVFQEKLDSDPVNYKYITGGQHGLKYTVFAADASGTLDPDFTKQYNAGSLFSGNQLTVHVNSDKSFSMGTNTGSFSRTNDNFELPTCYTYTSDLSTNVMAPFIYGQLEFYSRVGYNTDSIATLISDTVNVQDYKCAIECNGFAIDVTTINDLGCTEECDGFVEVVVTGGNAPFEYEWNTVVGSSIQEGLCADSVLAISVDDNLGCTLNQVVTIGLDEGIQGMGTGVCNLVTPVLPPGDPCGYNVDWALGMFALPTSERFYSVTSGEFDFDNGNTITATFQNATNPNAGFTSTFTFSTYMNWGTWSTQGFPTSYKGDCGGVDANHETWYYYLMTSGSLVGWGDYAGSVINVLHAPANNYFGFQLGDGANNYNADYGFGGWISYSGSLVRNGVPSSISGAGDLAFKLDCCGNNESRTIYPDQEGQAVNLQAPQLSLYPVPAQDFLIVQPSSLEEGNRLVRIFDQLGQVVFEQNLFVQEDTSIRLDISTLSKGIYLISVSQDNGVNQVGTFSVR